MIRFSQLKHKPADEHEIPLVHDRSAQKRDKDDTSINAAKHYRKLVSYLEQTFEGVRQGKPVDFRQGYAIISEIVHSPISPNQWFEVVNEIRYPYSSETFLVFHQVNVAIHAICLSTTLKLSKEEQCDLGLIALLHDIGKVRVPDEILFKNGKLAPSEWEILKRYPHESYEILHSPDLQTDLLAECALQVNETLDGKGYPRGLKGDTIHPYAQMIGLVDIYEAMTSNRPYRQKLLHYDAIKEILRTRKAAYPQSYIKALLKTFSVFPLNSFVKLNSGVIARIVEVHPELPMRPKVEVLFDAEKEHLAVPMLIDLASQPFLYITTPVSEDQLPVADSKIRILA